MIIKEQEILKYYVGLNTHDDIDVMATHIIEAQEEYLEGYLGIELTEKLDNYIEADKLPEDTALNRLLKKVERPLAYFAYMIATPFLDVVLTQSGFAVVSNQNLAPASKERVANLHAAIEALAFNSVERLLLFLEQNKTAYPEWASSEAYFEWNQYFVNTAKRFDAICNINGSRTAYLKMRQEMASIEALTVIPAITVELAEELKDQAKNSTLTEPNQIIYDLVQPATAHLTYAVHMKVARHEQIGETYLSRAVNIILQNQANYPAAASLFESTRTKRQALYQNTDESGFYVS